jgi:hypothetical protein
MPSAFSEKTMRCAANEKARLRLCGAPVRLVDTGRRVPAAVVPMVPTMTAVAHGMRIAVSGRPPNRCATAPPCGWRISGVEQDDEVTVIDGEVWVVTDTDGRPLDFAEIVAVDAGIIEVLREREAC